MSDLYEELKALSKDIPFVCRPSQGKVRPELSDFIINLEMRPEDVERRLEMAFLKSRNPMPWTSEEAPYGYVMTEGGPVRRAAPQFAFKLHDFGARGLTPENGKLLFVDGVPMGVIPSDAEHTIGGGDTVNT